MSNLKNRGFSRHLKDLPNAALQALDPSYQLLIPDPSLLDPSNTVLLEAIIKESVESNMHFQKNCRMGPTPPGGFGVVDSNGRVYGMNNLYVADNSIYPQCMDGSPMATAYLVAANIARLLGH